MPSQGTIGDRVRGLRLSKRMSQAQLAGPDLSDSYVSLIESGKRTPTPVVARLLAERLGCTTEFLLHGIEPRQRIDTELGLRHAELELYHGDPGAAAERFGDIAKAAGEDNAMLAAQARFGRARALEAQGKLSPAVEAYERLRREAAAHPERLPDLPLTVALCRCYQQAGDTMRAQDLGAHALEQAERLSIVQGELAADLAAALVELGVGESYVERVLTGMGLPAAVDRTAEVMALWQASTTAAEGEDSALAVRLADDALAAGRPGRVAAQLARTAMRRARILAGRPDGLHRAEELASGAVDILAVFPKETVDHARSLLVLAGVKIELGAQEEAARLAEQVLTRRDGLPPTVSASACLLRARTALARSQDEAASALAQAQELLQLVPASGMNREVGRVWRELGDLWGLAESPGEQAKAYRRALEAVGIRANIPGSPVPAALAH